jgi:hypothetical protein
VQTIYIQLQLIFIFIFLGIKDGLR